MFPPGERDPAPALPKTAGRTLRGTQAMSTKMLFVIPAMASAIATLGVFPGCSRSATQPESTVLEAFAVLRDASGETVGAASFTQIDGGAVLIEVALRDLARGARGIHIHTTGSCGSTETTLFGAAGGHFNPLGKAHGLQNPNGAHGGDLPNIEVQVDGTANLSITSDRISLALGATSLFDDDGSAVVLHAGADDQVTNPAGNSGARVACGVIESR